MPDPLRLPPELEELVRELARDPRSSLLRVQRPPLVRGVLERGSQPTTGLSAAEKELAGVHRTELAALLREACVMRLVEPPEADCVVGREVDVSRRVEVPRVADWRGRARHALDALDEGLPGADLIDLCVKENGERPSAAQLAAASLRLAPHDSARIYVGVDLVMRDEPRTAIRVLENVLAGAPSPLHASNAWENIGWALLETDRPAEALDAYRRAACAGAPRSTPLMNAFHVAVLLGETDEALRLGAELDELITAEHPSVAPFVAGVRQRRSEGYWAPTAVSTACLRRIADRLGPVARRCADVFA